MAQRLAITLLQHFQCYIATLVERYNVAVIFLE